MHKKPLPLRAIREAISAMLLAIVLSAAASAEESAHGGHDAGHDRHKHYVAGFIGGADEGRDEGLALAVEYERRLNARWGIGGVLEHTYGDLDTWVFAVPLAFHNGPWKLYAAPGVEDAEHGSEALLRLGVEYGFRRGKWEISPAVRYRLRRRQGDLRARGRFRPVVLAPGVHPNRGQLPLSSGTVTRPLESAGTPGSDQPDNLL